MASSTAPRRSSDVLLTTLDHPGAGVARDGGGEQREYAYYVFQDSCMRAICKEPQYHVQYSLHRTGSLHCAHCRCVTTQHPDGSRLLSGQAA